MSKVKYVRSKDGELFCFIEVLLAKGKTDIEPMSILDVRDILKEMRLKNSQKNQGVRHG